MLDARSRVPFGKPLAERSSVNPDDHVVSVGDADETSHSSGHTRAREREHARAQWPPSVLDVPRRSTSDE